MGKPFKIDQPPARNENAKQSPIPAMPGKTIVHNRVTGEPLPDAGADVKDHVERIPWPAADPLGGSKMPYKNLK